MKYVIFMAVLFTVFTTSVSATRCERHCPPKPTGTPLPSATATATASVSPSATPYVTATPTVSPQPTQEPTRSPQATPTTESSASSSAQPVTQSTGGDGRSDGSVDALGCQRPSDGCGNQPQTLGTSLPATGSNSLLLTVVFAVVLLSIGATLVWMTERQK